MFTRLGSRNVSSRRSLYRSGARMAATLVGDSGRVYYETALIQRNPMVPARGVFKAHSGAQEFIIKRTTRRFYDLHVELETEFPSSHRLRLHSDRNASEEALVYPYYDTTFLALLRDDPDFDPPQRLKILRHVGEAIQELHGKNWIHSGNFQARENSEECSRRLISMVDLKPDNIFINMTHDEQGSRRVSDAVLGDFDIAYRLEDGLALRAPGPVGNAMWRSPEGQIGSGITKSSDIYSFGLVCLYAMGFGKLLIIESPKLLEQLDISPEEEILSRHTGFFGPAPDALYKRIDDESRSELLKRVSTQSEAAASQQPHLRFSSWGKEMGSAAQDLVGSMTSMDPTARPSIDEVLEHPFWLGDDSIHEKM